MISMNDNGSITIPADVLAACGIFNGDSVRIVEEEGRIWIERCTKLSPDQATDLESQIDELERAVAEGSAPSFKTAGELEAYINGK